MACWRRCCLGVLFGGAVRECCSGVLFGVLSEVLVTARAHFAMGHAGDGTSSFLRDWLQGAPGHAVWGAGAGTVWGCSLGCLRCWRRCGRIFGRLAAGGCGAAVWGALRVVLSEALVCNHVIFHLSGLNICSVPPTWVGWLVGCLLAWLVGQLWVAHPSRK